MINAVDASTIFERFYPRMVTHIRSRYTWVERALGTCMVSVDDLVQVGAMELLRLANTWDDVARNMGVSSNIDTNGGLFWNTLAHRVKHRILTYKDQDTRSDNALLTKPATRVVDGEEIEDGEVIRTSLRTPSDPSLTHQEVVDFISLLPQRDKAILTLRYFDRLSLDEIGTLMESSKASVSRTRGDVVELIRTYAKSRIVDDHVDVPARRNTWWTPSPTLEHYLEAKHRTDLAGWLGYFTICCRADIGYLVDVLAPDRWVSPTIDNGRGSSLTDSQRAMIDALLAAGTSRTETARRVGATLSAVRHYSSRQAA